MSDALNDLLQDLHRAERAAPGHNDLAHQLLDELAARDGLALLDDLLDAGIPREVIALASQPGADKRQRPPVALRLCAGTVIVTLRPAGWQRVGQPNRREVAPGPATVQHRLAPTNFQRWLRKQESVASSLGVMFEVVKGVELRGYVEEHVISAAWQTLRHGANLTEQADAGQIVHGVFPDALVVETHDPVQVAATLPARYPHLGDPTALVPPLRHELVVAWEYESSAKPTSALLSKIDKHSTVMRLGGAWSAVVWVVPADSPDVAERLRRCGVLQRAGHYVASAQSVGCEPGDRSPVVPITWAWAIR